MGSEGQLNGDGTQALYEAFFKSVKTSDVTPTFGGGANHPKVLNPSHLDHLHMDRYVPLLLAYELADGRDETYERFVEQLKSSLAQALVAFYPVAGRVVNSGDLDHPRQFLLNDRGVPFSEALMDEKMVAFLHLPNFQPVAYLSGLEPAGLDSFKQIQGLSEGPAPAAIVQVTRFNCGGVVVAFTWNHMLADMTAAMQFMTAWSEISRLGQTSIKPDHNRALLTAQPHEQHQSSSQPTIPPPTATISAAEAAKIQEVLSTKYKNAILQVKKEPMDRLKGKLRQDHPELSTMDCLCAHLWRCLARVYADLGVAEVTTFTTAVEGRSRMGVSQDYFGNVVTSSSVMGVPAIAITSRPLSYAASLIHKAIRGITKETYWSIIEQMDLRNPWKTGINRTDYQLGVASWIRSGVNDIDFGIGKPLFVVPNLLAQNSRKGQCVVVPSPLGVGNFWVSLYLPPNILEALWADPEFTSLS